MVGNNAICYEAIQRRLRNAVVGYLRVRMKDVFPQDHIERLKKPLEKEWDALCANASACRQSGGTETQVRDEYDLLSVAHFFSLFDSYFDKLFSSTQTGAGTHSRPVKSKFLGNLKAIKDFRDPLCHPVSEEVSFEEGFGVLTDAKQVLNSLGLLNDAEEISQLTRQLHGFDGHAASRVVCSLPTQDSIYLDFVGRKQVLDLLRDWFSRPTNKRCLLAGDGGKGKSAVAYKFAQELSEGDSGFKLIGWLSAKRKRFEDGRVVPIDAPDFWDLGSALDRLLAHYGVLLDGASVDARKERLLALLSEFPAFLVVDDIDTILSDTEAVALFTFEIPSTKSAVLLTSRREIPGIKKFDIFGFVLEEAQQFVQSRIELYGLDPRAFGSDVVASVHKTTDGSPLYMDDLLRLVRVVPLAKALQMWSDKQGDEARKYALQREMEKLSADARRVLIAASVGDDPVSFAELESILQFSEERILIALNELQTLFLVPKPRVVEGEQRFELNSNTRKLVRAVEGGTDQYGRIDAKAKAIHGELPAVRHGVIGALIRQAFLLLNTGKQQEAEQLILQAIEKYPQAADIEGFAGFLYRRLGRFADAQRHFEAAYKLKCKSRDAYIHWVKMHMSQREWTTAISAADKGLRLIPDFYELHGLRAECKLRSGMDFSSRLQREKAGKLWAEAASDIERARKSPNDLVQGERSTNAKMFQTLIICLDLLGEYKSLYANFKQWASEHSDDPNVDIQTQFIEKKHGMSIEELSWKKPSIERSSHSRIDG